MNTQPRFTVKVLGHMWQGGIGAYSYTFQSNPSESDIRAKAGDFESVADYCVIEVRHGGTWEHEWIKREVVRPWQDSENEDIYLDCMGGN